MWWKAGLTTTKAKDGEDSAEKSVDKSEDGGASTWLYNAKELVKENHRCDGEVSVEVRIEGVGFVVRLGMKKAKRKTERQKKKCYKNFRKVEHKSGFANRQ